MKLFTRKARDIIVLRVVDRPFGTGFDTAAAETALGKVELEAGQGLLLLPLLLLALDDNAVGGAGPGAHAADDAVAAPGLRVEDKFDMAR